MVQLRPSLTLTLKHLASHGAVFSKEVQGALDHSLHIKRAEAGLKNLSLWGRIVTANGKDYVIAEGYNDPILRGTAVSLESRYFYSQDGVKWVDLQPVDQDTAVRATRITSILSGDAAKSYEIQEDDPHAPAAPPPEEGGGEDEGPKKLIFQIPELAVLRIRVDAISSSTSVVPHSALQADVHNRIVVNKLFAGAAYPEKLEAYAHRTAVPGGPTLAQDLRGTWAVAFDPFKGVSCVRSLLYPGYVFYYDANDVTWGGLYVGDGARNNDLIFML